MARMRWGIGGRSCVSMGEPSSPCWMAVGYVNPPSPPVKRFVVDEGQHHAAAAARALEHLLAAEAQEQLAARAARSRGSTTSAANMGHGWDKTTTWGCAPSRGPRTDFY